VSEDLYGQVASLQQNVRPSSLARSVRRDYSRSTGVEGQTGFHPERAP